MTTPFAWCVVGAGPAGISAVGLLLEASVSPSSILWIDPSFAVGDFGTVWTHVSSNTTVELFLKVYSRCKAFGFENNKKYEIERLDSKLTCPLDIAAEPLRDITTRLMDQVSCVKDTVVRLTEVNQRWGIHLSSSSSSSSSSSPSKPNYISANVILAMGSIPRTLTLHKDIPTIQEITVTSALNPETLAASVSPSDTVAVFGSSHTAIILIRDLLELQHPPKQIINFYREPLKYALYLEDSTILFDNTGLKGETARWARENMHGELPERVERVHSPEEGTERLKECTKVIYATGFEGRKIEKGVQGMRSQLKYNSKSGIIAPGLFGCGIGFPEESEDSYGNVEARVGLWKFMIYIERVLPLWMKYSLLEKIGQPKGTPGTQS